MTVDRSRLPQPGPTPAFQFPPIARASLPNGLGVWTVRHAAIPVATVMLLVPRGYGEDPAGKAGLAALTVDLLDEGTGEVSAIAFHEALARVGAQLDSDIGPDAAVFTLTVLQRFLRPAIDLLAQALVRPALRDADVTRVRQLRLHRLAQLRDMPGAIADRAILQHLYGTHPYGHAPLGNTASVEALTRDDVEAWHRAYLRPSEATLVVSGDCRHDDVVAMAAEAFGDWAGTSAARAEAAAPVSADARLHVIARPGAPQSELRIGHVGVARQTPDYHALVAANMVLGGQFSSRLNLNLREAKGLTYGVRTSFDFRRLAGPFLFSGSLQTSGTAVAIREVFREIDGLRGDRPVSDEELALAVAALTRGYARTFETAEQLARAAAQLALYGLPDTYFDEFVPRMMQVTPADVVRVAQAHLNPDRLVTVMVGEPGAVGGGMTTALLGLGLGIPSVTAPEHYA